MTTSRWTRQELVLVLLAGLLGLVLRGLHTDRLAVEHFDEGVYSSVLWYDASFGEPWPMRHLYAPPLLPAMIRGGSLIFSRDVAPFVPSILLGAASVLLVWWMTRCWFGMNAGLFAVFVFAFSDFHCIFSRMVLTDVPAMFWILSAVFAGSIGLQRACGRWMILAGLLTGMAWWTKYTGWLPLAIIGAGGTLWWLLDGRRRMSAGRLLAILLCMAGAAFVVWAPWLYALQSHGGYAAVAANHRGYVTDLTSWRDHLVVHLMYHLYFDSWLGAASVLAGMLAAGTRRWFGLAQAANRAIDRGEFPASKIVFPSPAVLARLTVAAMVLAIIASGISSFLLLTCVGIGGMAGAFLWPTLTELYRRREAGDLTESARAALPYYEADLAAAPVIHPLLGCCLAFTWFVGMLATIPLYQPYPRLSLNLLVPVIVMASGGLAWWIEATINVARRGDGANDSRPGDGSSSRSRSGQFMKKLMAGMVTGTVVLVLVTTDRLETPNVWQNRTSLRDAAWQMAAAVLKQVEGTYEPYQERVFRNGDGLIVPDPPAGAEPVSPWEELLKRLPPPADRSQRLADPDQPTCVVYAIGEPALLMHLNETGLRVAPVQDFQFSAAKLNGRALPTYLVFGPNAIRTDGLLNEWTKAQYRFERVDDFYFLPSHVVLLNLFQPDWLLTHEEARFQRLQVYRLRDDNSPAARP